ncbi:MAG TPA: GMC family oxidoreductase [Candidatus Kapabacteria bacterium]|nr:GMC family oxidoreductase [Candidatus Kapabacteria bacterium]
MAELDAGTLPPDAQLECDICIIGSGAAGITLAHRLLATGRNILLLESSLVDKRDPFATDQREAVQRFESTSAEPARELLTQAVEKATEPAPEAWNADGHRYEDPDTQPLYEGEVTPEMGRIDPRFLLRSRIRVYGGTTNCWGGWTRTLSPIDFDRGDLNPAWVWPIDAAELHPYYEAALEYCSLGHFNPYDYDRPEEWVGKTNPPIAVLPEATGVVRTGVFSIMNGNGPAIDGALDFQHVWGPDLIRSHNVTVVRNANVRRLETNGAGTAIARINAQTIDRSVHPARPGNTFTVRAKHVVLAAGGIETIRLLLISGGIGNGSGHLGRNFMVHPLNTNAGRLSMTSRPSVEVQNFYSRWPEVELKGYQWPPRIFATYVPTDHTLRTVGIGNFRAKVDFSSGNINLNWEQVPNPASTIRLSSTRRDLFGDPDVLLDWRTTALDAHTAEMAMTYTIAEVKKLGYASGGTSNPVITAPGDHHMGATRMSRDPRNGYVDGNCRSHEIENLYIASSSVFTTGGVSNPTLTIIALAVRLGDHLASL